MLGQARVLECQIAEVGHPFLPLFCRRIREHRRPTHSLVRFDGLYASRVVFESMIVVPGYADQGYGCLVWSVRRSREGLDLRVHAGGSRFQLKRDR